MPRLSFLVVVAMMAACTCIVGGDTAGKLLMQRGVDPLFVAWSRFAGGMLIVLPVSGMVWHELRLLLDWRLILRAGLIMLGIGCILTALRTEPIANVFGVFFIGPAVSYVLSVIVLRETVTLARSVMLGVGFVGVLMVVQPTQAVGPGMLWALLAGVFYGGYLTATRWLAPQIRPRFLLLSQLALGAVVMAPLGLTRVPVEMPPSAWALVLVSAAASAAGNLIIVTIGKTVPASVSSPLIYFQLVAATALGWAVFADWPDPLALAGLGVILASGLAGFVLARRA